MATKLHPKKDFNQLAFFIAQQVIREASTAVPPFQKKEKSGRQVGGSVRAKKLTPERRSEIAKQAATARWKTKRDANAEMLQNFPPKKRRIIA